MKNRFKMSHKLYGIVLVSLFCQLFFCSKNKNSDSSTSVLDGFLYSMYNAFQPDSVLTNTASLITTDYATLETKASSFYEAVSTYSSTCSGDYTSLINLRENWKSNMAVLKEIELIQFGPAIQGGYYERIDSYKLNFLSNPPDTSTINSIVSGSSTIDSSSVASMSKLAKGLPVIEYLLYDNGSGSSDLSSICSALTGRRLTLLTELVKEYHTNALNLKNAWDKDIGNFYTELAGAGKKGGYFKSKQEALNILITQINNEIEDIIDNKLAYPTGISSSSGGTIRVNYIESRYSGNAVTNMLNNMEGVKKVYTGNGSSGVSDYIEYYNPPLDKRITAQIDDVITKIGLIKNFDTSYQSTNVSEVQTAIDSLKVLRAMLTTELSATVGGAGTQTSSSGDGD